jgi:hypothetical protein
MYFSAEEIRLKVGTGWTEVHVVSEVGVVPTTRGYVPALEVDRGATRHLLLVGAGSLMTPLEQLRDRDGKLEGLTLRIRKAGEAPTSPYVVEEVT